MDITIGRVLKFLTISSFIAVVVWLIILLKSIIFLLVLSAVIAYILDPFASYLEFKGFSRLNSTIIIFLILLIVISAGTYIFIPVLLKELTHLQEGFGSANASELLLQAESGIQNMIPVLKGQDLNLYERVQSILKDMSESLFIILLDIFSIISTAVIIPFTVFFILKDGRKLKKNFFAIIPNRYFEMSLSLFDKVDRQLGSYLRGMFLEALIIGLLAILALWILDVKYFVLIGIFAGLANMIPYVGPLVGMITASSVVLLNNGSGEEIIWVLIAFGIIQLIDNVVVQPTVLAKSVNLHPLIIIFAIITGSQFFGVIGMLVAIPVTGIIKVVSMEAYYSVKHYNLI
jgi:predicted PurR-regulated permease PerM